MAAVQKASRIRLISPPGYQVVDRGYANEDFEAGDLILISSTAPPSTEYDFSVDLATGTAFHGVVLKDCLEGGLVEFVKIGELSGYTGLTPGMPLTVVGGVLDTTAPGAGVVAQVRARNAHSIYVNVV